MATRDIPKPSFKTCDETSLTLAWEGIGHLEPSDLLKLEYKKPNEEWVADNSVPIEKGESEAVIVEVIDLEPGTPYFVRIVVLTADGTKVDGPHTVFDTKQIDCNNSPKKCAIM
mmetsp:Transcript_8026/g.13613  ORF Transcript_8026/g.13613 Transcript_8026/m.13613 type:complete len:114 (-) Transcript_8026:186-527(-)|eukprot:CAMPEP_0114419106 /NCGR_PEP_ID=MMETSP0103-20121206/3852_1 /TAXON_ID=37642 ORGANISM="Paraphysomonas imperforata, Strain PA2" /NCGR_SAMPLE_ID=MMETSP0103 /ASSEMBLY_ACC=CAM_ASM_000201 /LENGTH=113 /DNA_ID=CAMNT_0001587507 /DNA_START=81 /DNA_END=422 /DNA_ORIENTATION=+